VHPGARVLIDARPALDPRRTGVGHYADRLIRHLPIADPGTRYVAWYLHARGAFRHRRLLPSEAANLSEHASRFPARVFQPLSWRAGLPRVEWLAGSFDRLLATNFLPPATGQIERCVLVVHDLAFERFPETAPHVDARWRRRFDDALARCWAVVVPSTSALDDLVAAHDVPEGRVHVVPHGIDPDEVAVPDAEVDRVRRWLGAEGPYALFVGGIEPRKNLERLVRAFATVPPPAALVLAGGPVRWDPGAVDRLDRTIRELPASVRDRIRRTGYVAERDKRALLAGATAMAYPSRYEGFGFPVLEAFAAGVPVLTSSVSSLPEVAGDAAVLVDPDDEKAIGEGLARLLEDEALRQRLRIAGRERAAGFPWAATARATAEVLRGTGDR